MHPAPRTLRADALAVDAADMMEQYRITSVLVVDAHGRPERLEGELSQHFKTQAERWLRDLDLVKREEFEAVKDMARLAREENKALKARIALLEQKAGIASPKAGQGGQPDISDMRLDG